MHTNTINYYNNNAHDFASGTRDVDFHIMQDKFLSLLTTKAHILDLGCGAGRDTKYFLEKGFDVSAIDGSEELCKIASKHTGIEVRNIMFQDIADTNMYDGIWACASLLHVNSKDIKDVLGKVSNALKNDGILYLSFKYGEFEGTRNGRFFLDMTERRFEEMIRDLPELRVICQEISIDIRPDRDEKWLNILLKKGA